MAIINKTGITNGGTIQAEHVTRTIDALSGVSTDSIIATGSFTGSFTGALTGTASYAPNAGAVNTVANSAESSNYYVLTAPNPSGQQALYTDSTLTFNPSTNVLTLTGSLTTSGSLTMTATPTSTVNFGAISSSGQFVIPLIEPTSPARGAMYYDYYNSNRLKIWDGATWLTFTAD